MAQEEVLVVGQISQGLFHPLLGALLDDAHIAEQVALALLDHQVLLHQLLEDVAYGGLVQAELIAQKTWWSGALPGPGKFLW